MLSAGPAFAAGPQQTIAQIQAIKQSAETWIDNRVDQYRGYLLTSPPPTQAAAERDRAIAEINGKAKEAEVEISVKMLEHPTNPDVQQAGADCIANVEQTAADASALVAQAYTEYVSGTTVPTLTTTTTSTSTSTTTTVPVVPATTVPTAARATTTTSTTHAPTSSTSARATTDPATTEPASQPEGAPGGGGPVLVRSRLLAAAAAAPDFPSFDSSASTGADIGPLIELLRLRLPSAVSDPLIDLYIVLRAIAAAFMSGIGAMMWPAGTLATGFAIHWGVRMLRRR